MVTPDPSRLLNNSMHNPFPNVSDEAFKDLSEKRRKFQYLASWQWPAGWLHAAERHKLAADTLYKVASRADARYLKRLLAEFKRGPAQRTTSREISGRELLDIRQSELFLDYLLLAGYALECLTKGLLMAKDPGLAHNKAKRKEQVTIHDLEKLCARCGIELSPLERTLVKVMTRHIEWGKYPAPLALDQTPSPIDTDDQSAKTLRIPNPFHEDQIRKAVDSLFLRLAKLLAACKTPEIDYE